MITVPHNAPTSTTLVQHYARLGDQSGIATLVAGVGYAFRPDNGYGFALVSATDPRLTLLGHVATADQQWQADRETRRHVAAHAAQEMSTTGVYKGFTLDELAVTFMRLHDPKDWRAPIADWVPGELVMVAVAAIEYYAATPVTVTLNTTTMQYLLTAIGYRQGPAGDH